MQGKTEQDINKLLKGFLHKESNVTFFSTIKNSLQDTQNKNKEALIDLLEKSSKSNYENFKLDPRIKEDFNRLLMQNNKNYAPF